MTFLTERVAELRRHLDHLQELRGRIEGPESLERDLSLHNVSLDMSRVVEALDDLAPIERFCEIVRHLEAET